MEWDDDYREFDVGSDDVFSPEHRAVSELSPTVLLCDKWNMRRGRELSSSCVLSPEETADFHAACFEPEPQLAANCNDERRERFIRELLEQPEYRALHNQCAMDTDLCEIAVASIAQQYRRYVARDESDKAREEKKQLPESKREENAKARAEMAAMGCAAMACKKVEEIVEEAELLMPGRANGSGKHDGAGGKSNMQGIRQAYNAVRHNARLRRIMEWAGRFVATARAKQANKREQGPDEVVGIECGDQLPKLLPSELMQYADPQLRTLFLQKFVEKQLLQRHTDAPIPANRGPIMLYVDGSGSMASSWGGGIEQAKGFACAIAWIAAKQKRHCVLVEFGSQHQRKTLVLKPGEDKPGDLANWLAHFFDGGTYPPIDEMGKLFEQSGSPKGATDIIILTDGEWGLNDEVYEQCLKDKAELKAKITTVLIGSSIDEDDARRVSDKVYKVSSVKPDSIEIGNILGL